MSRRRLVRLAGLVIGALALLVGAVWVTGWMLVRSGAVLEMVNYRPEKLRVEYASARSPWPGHLVVEGFVIRVQTKKVQWLATADRIEGDLRLLHLAARRFVASNVTAEGVDFRLRHRLDAFPEMDVPREQMPPIEGFDNPPRPPPERLYPLSEDRWRWTVSLHDWRLDGVREIWLDQHRYRGAAEVEGGYTVRLKRTTRLRPTRFSFHGGALHVGEQAIATGIEASLALASERFRHRQIHGAEVIPHFDTRLDVQAEVPDLSYYQAYLPGAAGLAGLSGSGTISGHLELRAADAAGSGWLDLHGRDLRLPYGDGIVSGDLALASRFPRIDLDARQLDLTGTTVRIDEGKIVESGARDPDAAPWWLRATLESGTLRPGQPVALEAAASAQMTDSRPLAGLFVLRGKVPAGGVLMLTYRGLDLGVLLRDEETEYKLIDVDEWYEQTMLEEQE